MKPLLKYLQLLHAEFKNIELASVFRFKSFERGENFGPHRHQRIEINFIQKGSCTMVFGDESATFQENEMMILLPLVEHTFIPHEKGVSLMQLEFMPDLFYLVAESEGQDLSLYEKIFSDKSGRKYIKIINNIRLIRAVQRIVDELIDEKQSYDLLVLIYYAELLLLISRQMMHPALPIKEGPLPHALAIIQASFTYNISMKDVASQCGVSERYLRKLFSSQLHISYTDYINELRINKAKELLHHTHQSVKEVAYLCGFHSVEYFSRVFKQHTNTSPSNYNLTK